MSAALGADTVARALQAAGTACDPELPMLTLADLGILRDVHAEGGRIVVELTPTYSGCPALLEMRADVAGALHRAGFHDVEVRTVLSPPWSSDDITEHGRALLAEHGIAPPVPKRALLQLGGVPRCPHCGSPDTVRLSAFGVTACRDLHRCNACREAFERVKTI